MDRTQSRMILAMAALLITASIVLWQQGQPEPEADPEATEPIWTLSIDQVDRVDVQRESGSLSLERSADGWLVTEPFRSRADDDQVHDLLDSLREMARGIPVEVPAERAVDFGLGEPPHARVTVWLDDGTSLTRDVGIPVPIGFRTYVRAAAGGVVAANGDPNRSLQAEARRFQDHHIFRFDAGAVRDVSVAGPQGTLHVSGEGLDWWLDGFTRADPDRVDDLVVGLLDLRFDTILDLDQHVGDPTWDVRVTQQDGAELWLKVGEETPMGVLAETSDGRVGMVFPDMLRQLGRGPTDVGVRTAFGIRLDGSDAVQVDVPGRHLAARRNGPGWEVDGLDEGTAYDVVDALAGVPIRYLADPAGELGDRWGEVLVTDGDQQRGVILGSTVVDGHRIALDKDGGATFRIPADVLERALEGLPAAE